MRNGNLQVYYGTVTVHDWKTRKNVDSTPPCRDHGNRHTAIHCNRLARFGTVAGEKKIYNIPPNVYYY